MTDAQSGEEGFRVRLRNFEGPFDLLLQLIGEHKLDVTEVALHVVTDDFIAYTRELGERSDLDDITEFLVIASTLLDLKAARLLPAGEVDDEDDLELLEIRDLLFARILQYRAYKQVAEMFAVLESAARLRYPVAVPLEDRFAGLLPEVRLGVGPQRFAEIAAAASLPRPAPQVGLEHLHIQRVSVAEHAGRMLELLRDIADGAASFAELVAECTTRLEIVARFLGLLELYRQKAVVFVQPDPLGDLLVRVTGDADAAWIDEEEYG